MIWLRRSKLEFYQDIICTLAKKALTIDALAYECNMDCSNLQERMNFLVNQNLVSIEISQDNVAFYVLTRRGAAISKTFKLAKQLERLQTKPDSENSELNAFVPFPEPQQQRQEPRARGKRHQNS